MPRFSTTKTPNGFYAAITSDKVLDMLSSLTVKDFHPEHSASAKQCIEYIGTLDDGSKRFTKTWEAFVRAGLGHVSADSDPRAVEVFRQVKELLRDPTKATHRQKRGFIKDLGLEGEALTEQRLYAIYRSQVPSDDPDLLRWAKRLGDSVPTDVPPQEVLGALSVRFCERRKDDIPTSTLLTEIPVEECDPMNLKPRQKRMHTDSSWEFVGESESVIFLSWNDNDQIQHELAIMRPLPNDTRLALVEWFTSVINSAVRDRRNVRPNHIGNMVQIGYNTGPRHAKVTGLAKSFQRTLTPDKMAASDTEVIGMVSLFWSLMKAWLPQDVIAQITNALDEHDLPRIATRNVKAGAGFNIQASGVDYRFDYEERAPPEAYLTYGYVAHVHADPTYAGWALAACVQREVKDGAKLARGGANFFDVGLRIIIKQSAGTIWAFRPQFRHGTTEAHGAVNWGITFGFSERLAKAWDAEGRDKQIAIVSKAGAGEGNPDA
ncbi:hypothetical protein BXZ70DRAFT_926698 [Cristinia sonorae]|uniref:Uncharacterized protein n=1 Tax=Cristinia sonorae TaxID=1940300 RepID=A0A8K0UTE6_9AGAR|nr:hypothetical protein BXZ70DRAFT_926698 [Cristinia sonorae]